MKNEIDTFRQTRAVRHGHERSLVRDETSLNLLSNSRCLLLTRCGMQNLTQCVLAKTQTGAREGTSVSGARPTEFGLGVPSTDRCSLPLSAPALRLPWRPHTDATGCHPAG